MFRPGRGHRLYRLVGIDTVDNWVRPWFPRSLSPDGYLPFHIPGFGVVIAVVGLTLLAS